MLIQDFNNGWGDNIELRRFEKNIVKQYLGSWYDDNKKNITVNSTWYSQQYHAQVLEFCRQETIERVALVCFLDPPIVNHQWFEGTDLEIVEIGYYRGPNEIDAWALIVDRYFQHQAVSTDANAITVPYLCLNRKPHPHRIDLYRKLQYHGILDSGIVTLGDSSGIAKKSFDFDVAPSLIAPNPGIEQYGIVNDIMSLGPIEIWNRCFLNLVTETVFDIDKCWFVSEKIYKPLLGLRPFLVYSPGGGIQWLDHVGVSSYVQDFSDITDLDLSNPDNIPEFLKQLIQQPQSYFASQYTKMLPKMLHNRAAFGKHVEMIKNKIQKGVTLKIA